MKKNSTTLIYYSQIELDLKNDVVAHEASLKQQNKLFQNRFCVGAQTI
jgi:hypothetical protein